MKCKFCAEDIADGAIKCKHCGSMQNVKIEKKQCQNCFASIPADAQTCEFCKKDARTKHVEPQQKNTAIKGLNQTSVQKKKVIAATAVVLCAIILFFSFASSDLRKAKKFVEAANYSQAIVYFDKAIVSKPNSTEAYIGKGYCYILLKNYNAAEECVVSAYTTNSNLIIGLATFLWTFFIVYPVAIFCSLNSAGERYPNVE